MKKQVKISKSQIVVNREFYYDLILKSFNLELSVDGLPLSVIISHILREKSHDVESKFDHRVDEGTILKGIKHDMLAIIELIKSEEDRAERLKEHEIHKSTEQA